jgi:hypothetical protein
MVKRSPSEEPNIFDEKDDIPISPTKKPRKSTGTSVKWSEAEWERLCALKNNGLSWPYDPDCEINSSEMAEIFPGRSAKGLRLHYQGRIKAEQEVFTQEKVFPSAT